MLTSAKRQPAFTDTDPMPFGKHQGLPLQDVPPSYLEWLWGELRKDGYNSITTQAALTDVSFQPRIKLANYIHNSKSAIEQELGHAI